MNKPKTYGAFNEFCHPDCPYFNTGNEEEDDYYCSLKPYGHDITIEYYDGHLAHCADMEETNSER